MATSVKDEARQLLDGLPDGSTWDDVLRLVEERRRLQKGLDDFEAGRVLTQEEVECSLGVAD